MDHEFRFRGCIAFIDQDDGALVVRYGLPSLVYAIDEKDVVHAIRPINYKSLRIDVTSPTGSPELPGLDEGRTDWSPAITFRFATGKGRIVDQEWLYVSVTDMELSPDDPDGVFDSGDYETLQNAKRIVFDLGFVSEEWKDPHVPPPPSK